MAIQLRTEEINPLSWEQVDSNFSSLVYTGSMSGSNLVLEYYQGGEFTRDNLVLPIISSSYAVTSSITTAITGSAGYIPVFSGARTLVNSSMIYENNGDDNIGIGTNSPQKSAILELNSDRKGFLPPRMTSSEMNAIDSPAQGLMVYNTSEKKVAVYVDSGWRLLAFV